MTPDPNNHSLAPQRHTLLVGITGQARAGKDTFTRLLLDTLQHYNVYAQKVAFATPLKQIYVAAQQLVNADDPDVVSKWIGHINYELLRGGLREGFDRQKELNWLANCLDWSQTVRDTPYAEDTATKAIHRRNLIDVGCHFREVNPNFWVNLTLEAVQSQSHFAFITDLRFPNEALVCDYIIRVVRPGTAFIYNAAHTEVDQSETFAMTGQYDYIVDNSGSIADLAAEAKDVVEDLIIRRVVKMNTEGN